MIRVRWSKIDGVYIAARRGHIARVMWSARSKRWWWVVKTPDGVTYIGPTTHRRSQGAKRAARNSLVGHTPAPEPKEQMEMRL